jgi:hypothetical protein
MNYQWQSEIFSVLDHNHVSMYDLLIFTLCTRLPPVHFFHRELLQHRTSAILDLWSEQFPSDTRTWALQAARETYQAEVIKLIHPHAGFHFRGTRACLEQLENFSMVDMGKKIKEAAPCLWDLLGVLLDADLTRRRAAPKLKTYVEEDVEMDLGDIGTEGAQQEQQAEDWADLNASDAESSSSEDEDESSEVFSGLWNQLNPEGETAEPDSDVTDDEDDIHLQHHKKQRCRKQDPAKRNAVLLAIVSLFLLHVFVQC